MTSEGLGEMYEGDSADKCGGKFPLVLKESRAEGLACADPGANPPLFKTTLWFVAGFQIFAWVPNSYK